MATPIILKTGSSSGPGTPGEGSNDLDIGENVVVTDTEPANAGAPHYTEFEDVPIGSALAALTDPATESPSFIPDITGSYRLKMTVDGAETSVEIFAVPLARSGRRIPSFQETAEYDGGGNTKGWHRALTDFMRLMDANYQLTMAHAPTHIRGAADEIDGDKVDIDWAPTNYTRDASPPQVSSVEHLAANLKGIDNKLGSIPGASGQKFITTMQIGRVTAYQNATPLIVCQFEFDPTGYALSGTAMSLKFRAVVGNGMPSITTNARLYNLSDTEYVGTGLTFITEAPAAAEEFLVLGSGAGEVKPSAKIYEVHVWVTSPSTPDDTINMGGAELQVINTIS